MVGGRNEVEAEPLSLLGQTNRVVARGGGGGHADPEDQVRHDRVLPFVPGDVVTVSRGSSTWVSGPMDSA